MCWPNFIDLRFKRMNWMNFREWDRFFPVLRQLHPWMCCVSTMWMKQPMSTVVSCAGLYAVKRGDLEQWDPSETFEFQVNWGSASHEFHPISPMFVEFPLWLRSNLGHLEGSAAAIAMNKCILVVMHAMAVWSSVTDFRMDSWMAQASSGWWFGTFFIFPYTGNNHPNWLSYFSEGFKPPTSHDLEGQLEAQTRLFRVLPLRLAQLPTQHVKCLNPHLDHAAFDALYTHGTYRRLLSGMVECYDLLWRCGMDSKW